MTDFDHQERLSRETAAERLADLAFALTAGRTLELGSGADRVKVPVADTVLLKRESRPDGERIEVRIELTWSA